MVTSTAAPHRATGGTTPGRVKWGSGARELILLAGLYVLYSLTRVLASNDLAAARGRARHLVHLEGVLHLDVEARLNQATSVLPWLAVPMDFWYAALHYLVTPAVLGFVFFRRRKDYPQARNALVITSMLGLGCYLFLPTAPPRLTSGSTYIDTLQLYAHLGWWSGHASAPSGLAGFTNELAAMPSLHVGWAVWVAWVLRRRLAYVYPAVTAFVVVCTGNHWVLDCVVGVLLTLTGVAAANLRSTSALRSAARAGSPVPEHCASAEREVPAAAGGRRERVGHPHPSRGANPLSARPRKARASRSRGSTESTPGWVIT